MADPNKFTRKLNHIAGLEIGDTKDNQQFHPQHKLLYWNNDVNVSMRLVAPGGGQPEITLEGETVSYTKGDIRITWTKNGEGVEQLIYLASRPQNDEVRFTINSKDLDFFLQPDGSYAIYHKTKTNFAIPRDVHAVLKQRRQNPFDITAQEHDEFQLCNYGTGKADHWHNRNVIGADAVVTIATISMNPSNTILTYTLSPAVVYPAVID